MQLRSIKIKSVSEDKYPFNLPIIKSIKEIRLTKPITVLVGENGSGKSTLLESLAVATELPTIGNHSSTKDPSLKHARELANSIKLTWSINNHRGFFMRAEDFFGFQKDIAIRQEELRKQKDEYNERFTGYANLLTTSSTQNQLDGLEKRYGKDPDAFSHGESFLNLFIQRFVPKGLYILDEPEVPLSPKRQLSLISLIKEQAAEESQFIIATHSPIIMALPDAEILEIDGNGVLKKTSYDDLDHVSTMRDFLSNPNIFIKRL